MTEGLKLLEGVRVVAFTTFLIGPAAVQYLADMGADVVKVEEPVRGPHERHWSGAETFLDDVSVFFLMSNRNMRSVALDLKQPDGRDVALDLCRDADVVVSNFRPAVMERLGLDYETLSARKPDLIYASASGYGSDSPYRELPGQDLLLQATSGLASVTGSGDGPPVAAGAAIVDQHAAALLALGLLGALHRRAVTGEGQRVEVTMVQAALDLQSEAYAYHLNGGDLQRPTNGLATSYHEAPYGCYAVRDGHVVLSLSPLRVISAALGDPPELQDLLDPADAWPRREAIAAKLAPLLAPYGRDELLPLLREHDIWCAPVNTYAEALADPVVAHLEPLREFEHPLAGLVRVIGHPIRYGSGTASVRQPPPALGEHTEEVLTGLGYDGDRVAELRAAGVVR